MSEILYTKVKAHFKNNKFHDDEWFAPYMIDVNEIKDRMNGFNLVGRKIRDVRFIGLCYNLCRERIEEQAYVSYNGVVYSAAPYLEGYGHFDFRIDLELNQIRDIRAYAFDDEEYKIVEFIKTDDMPGDNLFDYIPQSICVNTLDPVNNERFAFIVRYENGECRKYVLPIDSDEENDEVVEYCNHVFTDAIWKSAEICEKNLDALLSLPYRRPEIKFKNEYRISSMYCYEKGIRCSEP